MEDAGWGAKNRNNSNLLKTDARQSEAIPQSKIECMNKNRKEWGDLLAEDVIHKHKKIILCQPTPNYFLWPVKYCFS